MNFDQRQSIIQAITSKTGISMSVNDMVTRVRQQKQRAQTCLNWHRYLGDQHWDRFIANSSWALVLRELVTINDQLGLHWLSEQTATHQISTTILARNRQDNLSVSSADMYTMLRQLKAAMRSLLSSRATRQAHHGAVINYPSTPSELMTQHPLVYAHFYKQGTHHMHQGCQYPTDGVAYFPIEMQIGDRESPL